jgi:hypothetical protein
MMDFHEARADLAKRKVAVLAKLAKYWDESKHPRGEHGRFSGGGGSSSTDSAPQSQHRSRLQGLFDRATAAWGSAKPVLGKVASLVGRDEALGIAIAIVAGATMAATNRSNSEWQARFRSQGDQRSRSSRSHATAHEHPAAAEVRMKHGAKAAAIMALYLKPGTPGEKAAAEAALRRMGIDPSAFAKLLRMMKANSNWKAAFASLDHLLTEDEAEQILAALLKHIHPAVAQQILDNAKALHP